MLPGNFETSIIMLLVGAVVTVAVQLIASAIRWALNRKVAKADADAAQAAEQERIHKESVATTLRDHGVRIDEHGRQIADVTQAHQEMSKRLDSVERQMRAEFDAMREKTQRDKDEIREALMDLKTVVVELKVMVQERTGKLFGHPHTDPGTK